MGEFKKNKHGRSKVKILVLTVATKNLCAFIPIIENNVIIFRYIIVQKMKFSIKDFYSKYDRIRRKLRIWSHLLQKSLMENIFCAVYFEVETMLQNLLVLFERTRGTPVKRLKAIVTQKKIKVTKIIVVYQVALLILAELIK